MANVGGNGWDRHQLLVLTQLAEMKSEISGMRDDLSKTRVELAMLKVKSGLWGATAGAIPAAVALALVALGGN